MRIWKLVGLEAGQWTRALSLWGLLFLLTLSFELGSEALKAIFLARIGGRALPPAFVLEAAMRLAATALYFVLLRRADYTRVMIFTTLGYATALLGLMGAMRADVGGSLMLFYAVERVGYKLIMLHWGVYVVDFFTVRESSTAFPFVYSAQPLAAVVAGALLAGNPLADLSWLFVVAAAAAGLALLLIRQATAAREQSPRLHVQAPGGAGAAPERPDAAPEGRAARRAAWQYVWRAPVVRYMALATGLLVFVRAFLDVSAALVLERVFQSAQDIGQFLGYYKIVGNVLFFGVQALAAARLMKAASPVRVNMAYAVLVVGAFASLLVAPGVGTLVFARSVDEEWKALLKTPFSVMMYGAMADFARAAARIAVFGVVVPLAGIAAGLGMMGLALERLALPVLAAAGLGLALLFVVVTLLQNRAYKLALVELLRRKLGMEAAAGTTSSILRVPDGRILEIRKVRQRANYPFVRFRVGAVLFPDLYEPQGDPDAMPTRTLMERLEELLLMVELYRPKGAPHLRSTLVAALRDRRVDLLDNATEVFSSVLPPRFAARGRALLDAGLRRGLELR